MVLMTQHQRKSDGGGVNTISFDVPASARMFSNVGMLRLNDIAVGSC